MPGALDQPLPDADELRLPARVDAVLAGAVLARDLAGAGVDAEPLQRALDDAGDRAEAVMRAGPGVLRRPGPGERDRVLVEDGGAPAGEALDRLEAAGAGGGDRVGVAGAVTSCFPNATIAPGRARRNVSGSSPRATRSRIACETAVS